MTNPTLTYRHGFTDDCNTIYNGTTGTADAGGDLTHTVDAERTEGDDYWNGHLIRYTSGSNAGEERIITDFDAATDTITHVAFGNATVAGDVYELSEWAETEDGLTATLSVDDDDIFNINVTADAGNKTVYYSYPGENTSDNISISSSTYGKFIARYKTSDASIKAKIELVFNDASTQTVLDETSSTTWKTTGIVDITPAKTIDHIRLYATQAQGDVYYDFLLICKGQFTWPHVGPGGVEVDFPVNIVKTRIPGKWGQHQQNMGMDSPTITVTGDVHPNETAASGSGGEWESGSGSNRTGPHFQYILDALHKDPWNWFTCDDPDISCQVMIEDFKIHRAVSGGEVVRKYVLTLSWYKRSSLDLATWGDEEWLGYE